MKAIDTPILIIAGVHKAGTTSLYRYLSAHPEVCASTKKEIHYFTPLRYGGDLANIDNYLNYFSHLQNEKFLFEASPSYMYGLEKVADQICNICSDPYLIVLLRKPTDRFVSFYKHLKTKLLIPDSVGFAEFFNRCYAEVDLEDRNDYYRRGLREGKYVEYLPFWLDRFGGRIKVYFFENLIRSPESVVLDICEWLKIDRGFYEQFAFTNENKTVNYKNKFLQKIAISLNDNFEYFLRSYPAIKEELREIYYKLNGSSRQIFIDKDIVDEIEEFYKQFNNNLYEFLKKYDCKNIPGWLAGE